MKYVVKEVTTLGMTCYEVKLFQEHLDGYTLVARASHFSAQMAEIWAHNYVRKQNRANELEIMYE